MYLPQVYPRVKCEIPHLPQLKSHHHTKFDNTVPQKNQFHSTCQAIVKIRSYDYFCLNILIVYPQCLSRICHVFVPVDWRWDYNMRFYSSCYTYGYTNKGWSKVIRGQCGRHRNYKNYLFFRGVLLQMLQNIIIATWIQGHRWTWHCTQGLKQWIRHQNYTNQGHESLSSRVKWSTGLPIICQCEIPYEFCVTHIPSSYIAINIDLFWTWAYRNPICCLKIWIS